MSVRCDVITAAGDRHFAMSADLLRAHAAETDDTSKSLIFAPAFFVNPPSMVRPLSLRRNSARPWSSSCRRWVIEPGNERAAASAFKVDALEATMLQKC